MKLSRFAMAVLLGSIFAATGRVEAAEVSLWFRDGQTNTAAKPLAEGRSIVSDRSKKTSAVWAPVSPPQALPPGASATLTCKIMFGQSLSTNSSTQIRIGMFGEPGNGTTTEVHDTKMLRGFIVTVGNSKGDFVIENWIRDGNENAVMTMKSAHSVEQNRSAGTDGEAGKSYRLVMTIKRNVGQHYEVSGFFGDHAYAFRPVGAPFELDDICAVGFLNGQASGVDTFHISDVRISVTAP
jgi:hypothetical protein